MLPAHENTYTCLIHRHADAGVDYSAFFLNNTLNVIVLARGHDMGIRDIGTKGIVQLLQQHQAHLGE